MDLLVVEDDARISRLVERALTNGGHRVEVAADGLDGLSHAERGIFDVVVLDWMLPGMDGLEVAQEMRRSGLRTPILMLTARDAVADRVRGLDGGADDYLTKPFALEELLARVRALGRRASESGDRLTVGDLTLDIDQRQARRGNREIELTAKEFDLLSYLMRNAGRILDKYQILSHVWGYDSEATPNNVETYIHYLREKVDRGFPRPLIRTVRGVGYSIKGPEGATSPGRMEK